MQLHSASFRPAFDREASFSPMEYSQRSESETYRNIAQGTGNDVVSSALGSASGPGARRLGVAFCIFFLGVTGFDTLRAQTTEKITHSFEGGVADQSSVWPKLSADGRFVAFSSWASNLVPDDDNDSLDAFVHDRSTGETSLVSVFEDSEQRKGASWADSISDDGRFVAFTHEYVGAYVDGEPCRREEVFVRDLKTRTTRQVSLSSSGEPGIVPDCRHWYPRIGSHGGALSGGGRFVAFTSSATGLVPEDLEMTPDIFVHDLQTGETTRVSVSPAGAGGNNFSQSPVLSGDGRFVAFSSNASNLVEGDTNGAEDIFVRDRISGRTTRVSVATNGSQTGGGASPSISASTSPFITSDGRFVAFQSAANNLVADDTNGAEDIFVHDRMTGETSRVNLSSDGTESREKTYLCLPCWDYTNHSYLPSISTDGRFVAFVSEADDLVAQDSNRETDLLVRDRRTGRILLSSVSSSGEQFVRARTGSISADGRVVAFSSSGLRDDQQFDIFVNTLERPELSTPRFIFAQFVSGGGSAEDGRVEDLGTRCRIVLVNTGQVVDSGVIRFRDPTGNLRPVPVREGQTHTLGYNLPPGGTATFETVGTGPLLNGVIEVTSDLKDRSQVQGTEEVNVFEKAVSVPGMEPQHTGRYFVSVSEKENTGLAIFNPDREDSITLDLSLFDDRGFEVARKQISLGALRQLSRFVSEAVLFGSFFEALEGPFEGSLQISGSEDREFVALGLLQERDSGSLLAVDLEGAVNPSGWLVFPQFADGETYFGGNVVSNRTRMTLVNNGEQLDSGFVRFRDSTGSPREIGVDGKWLNQLEYSLPSGGIWEVWTDGKGPLKTGSIEVESNLGESSLIRGAEIFDVLGHFVSIPPSAVSSFSRIYLSRNAQENTGFAILNADGWESASLEVVLRDDQGEQLERRAIVLEPFEQLVRFVDENGLFEEFFMGRTRDFSGTLEVRVTKGDKVAGLGLLQNRATGALVAVVLSNLPSRDSSR